MKAFAITGLRETGYVDIAEPEVGPGQVRLEIKYVGFCRSDLNTYRGLCLSCLKGRPNCCRYNETLGVQRDGALTKCIVVPWEKLYDADGIAEEYIELIEPLTVGGHAADRSEAMEDDVAAVIGYLLRRAARFLNRKSQRRYRLRFADTYYGELNHYGMHWLKWADVRR